MLGEEVDAECHLLYHLLMQDIQNGPVPETESGSVGLRARQGRQERLLTAMVSFWGAAVLRAGQRAHPVALSCVLSVVQSCCVNPISVEKSSLETELWELWGVGGGVQTQAHLGTGLEAMVELI